MNTLPDYLAPHLDIIFVGINPSLPSAQQGHYYANPRNRFWRAWNLAEMTPEPLWPETDYQILKFGMGFTDLVKRASGGMAELTAEEFRLGATTLQEKLLYYQPRLICFQGITAYKMYLRYTHRIQGTAPLGLQSFPTGAPQHFVVPNPSPANARFSLAELVQWYRQLKGVRDALSKVR